MLGKRKRETQVVSRTRDEAESEASHQGASVNINDIFRKHFEATFSPLPEEDTCQGGDEDEDELDDSDAESEVSVWSGLSETRDDPLVVEVVDYAIAKHGDSNEFHRARQKAFMSSRPPRDIVATNENRRLKTLDEDDPAEKLNLKHDLDLQRLLKESHLLEKSKASENPSKQRHMALELRLQELGAKQSILTQQKMPAAHRIGMAKKADHRETLRRREAKENGVILEKAAKKSKNVRRDRGVDVPGVGKFAGGTLKLSRRDIASIQGPPTTTTRKGKRK
ncbi:pre-rRNA processing and 40S ribosomal subunit assembly [Lithohypha guttulata]|nr:pre-rRNA processing and 40S ribosomal subunit assembly [Lithohypha guttulata]